jgi:predicted DNA-binding transcriptional regulator AlpA
MTIEHCAISRQLRYADLVNLGIVGNRVTLHNWIRDLGFPRGSLIGSNTRVWAETDVQAWLASRPTAPRLSPNLRTRRRKAERPDAQVEA